MDKASTRRAILHEAIMLAPFEGWTEPMLKRATARAGLSNTDLTRCFQTVLEVLEFWSAVADEALQKHASTLPLSEMKIRERIAELVFFRINTLMPAREAARRAAHHLALPWNVLTHIRLIQTTMNLLWECAGDTSHDYNWYSKRVLLAGVYSSTFIFWLNDHSEHQQETKNFLHHRIDEVLKIGGALSRVVKHVA